MSSTPASLADAAIGVRDAVLGAARFGVGLLRPPRRRLDRIDRGCHCDVPSPCWMPQPLGDVVTRVCPGNQAVVRVKITNCGISDRRIEVDPADPDVSVDPVSLTLGPMESGTIVLSLPVEASASDGETRELAVWVRGCKEYFFRWTIEVSCKREDCCVDVYVDDCPDLVHHWYDHFYCQRPCVHQG